MEIKTLGDLVEELVANGIDCAYVEKFNSIFVNDDLTPEYTKSIYEKNGKFYVNVKIKGKPKKEHTEEEKKVCYKLQEKLTTVLNDTEVYKFPVFKTAEVKPAIQQVAKPLIQEDSSALDDLLNS